MAERDGLQRSLMLFVESHRPLAFVMGHLLWLLQPVGGMLLPGLPLDAWAERLCASPKASSPRRGGPTAP